MLFYRTCQARLVGTTSNNSFCSFYLTQVICRRAVIVHAMTIGTTSSVRITTQACNRWESRPVQTVLLQLQPTHTHATGTHHSWPVLSANLKRKMRSWWGAEGPVQRRPVEGCRAEKILRSTNKNMEKKKGRKREERQKTWTVVSEWVKEESWLPPVVRPTRSKQLSYRSFFNDHHLVGQSVRDKQEGWLSLTENTANQTNKSLYICDVYKFCLFCEYNRKCTKG